MSFSKWKERSKLCKLIPDMRGALHGYGKPLAIGDIDRIVEAAYKAGEREGRKQVETIINHSFNAERWKRENL